jgi:hypothetical protein
MFIDCLIYLTLRQITRTLRVIEYRILKVGMSLIGTFHWLMKPVARNSLPQTCPCLARSQILPGLRPKKPQRVFYVAALIQNRFCGGGKER